ncbi:hypothetical protein DSO57_1013317 [Entomophthora muscae]|uniref:Uncharacterized protein n=1 Tax=Entomophthora muscae TaxID=34485 RepID=A0ACC2UF33_9FUNG|nr:hypothetical protein DSO57_1013317 [Entomophthora muscae]
MHYYLNKHQFCLIIFLYYSVFTQAVTISQQAAYFTTLLNSSLDPANDNNNPKDVTATTLAAINETPPELPQDHGLQRDDKSVFLKGEFKIPRPVPANVNLTALGTPRNVQTLFDLSGPAPAVNRFQETSDQPPKLYCPTGVQ